MPVTGQKVFEEAQRASYFSHKAEKALPYYYRVFLADHNTTVEMTPTDRAALFRVTYPETDQAYLVVDAYDKGSYIKVLPEQGKVIGWSTRCARGVPDNFKNYFVIQFDAPLADAEVWERKGEALQSDERKHRAGLLLHRYRFLGYIPVTVSFPEYLCAFLKRQNDGGA